MTGFRIKSNVPQAFKKLGEQFKAGLFEPDVMRFLKKSLTTAIPLTTARDLGKIKKAQRKQYSNRINYVPSYHELLDPTLIVSPETGIAGLYCGGKWYAPEGHRVPPEIDSVYMELNAERERRMQITEEAFIAERAQARFLYKRSWYEIGQSAGLEIACPQRVKDSHSRRTKSSLTRGHRQNPPRGYVQKRGGKGIYSIVVYNPFLQAQTEYWQGDGKRILAEAMSRHKGDFDAAVAKRQYDIILKILLALLRA